MTTLVNKTQTLTRQDARRLSQEVKEAKEPESTLFKPEIPLSPRTPSVSSSSSEDEEPKSKPIKTHKEEMLERLRAFAAQLH